jgi:L-cysteine/cystine lyase
VPWVEQSGRFHGLSPCDIMETTGERSVEREKGESMTAETVAQTDVSSEQDKIAAIRAELPVTQAYAYLNAGTNGPLPRRSHEALVSYAQEQLEAGRIGEASFQRYFGALNEARERVARLLGCDPLEVALTHNTTEGMNIAVMGLDWREGDEVITASTEHPGGLYPVLLLRQRYGVRIRMTEIGLPGRDPLAELRAALSPRTRAVVLSHVCWVTGMALPIREIADLAHRAGALLICDAAQACGMLPSQVYDLQVDAYACSGQKWLCGPDGTGALFVRKDRMGEIQQSFMGYPSIRPGMYDLDGHFVPGAGARRYEAATLYPPAVAAFATGLDWIAEEIGWDWAYRRIATLARYTYDALAGVEGVTLLTPQDQMAGLVHFTLEGCEPETVSAQLGKAGFLVRHTPYPPAVRISTGFYNTEDEIDRLVEAVRAIQANG